MKPKPLASLNHLTVPVAIVLPFRELIRALTRDLFEFQARNEHHLRRRKLEAKHPVAF
jgi:hypothetical protein